MTGDELPLALTIRYSDRALVLTALGIIDLVTAPRLHQALELALMTCPRLLVVDLSSSRLLACAELPVLVAVRRWAVGYTCLRVVAGRRPLALTAGDDQVSVYRTRTEALADFVPCSSSSTWDGRSPRAR